MSKESFFCVWDNDKSVRRNYWFAEVPLWLVTGFGIGCGFGIGWGFGGK